MSVAACAALVAKGDPDRFAATLAASPAARSRLWPLYALNLEIARIPFVTAEPLIAEMRLQWWSDTVAAAAQGAIPRQHEVAGPLAALLAEGLPDAPLQVMIAARRRDIWRDPFGDLPALLAHLDATAGNLAAAAALALAAPGPAVSARTARMGAVTRDAGLAVGVANWLLALPELTARGLPCLPAEDPACLPDLAAAGQAALGRARRGRADVPAAARAALFPAALAAPVLAAAAADPARVLRGALAPAEFRRRLVLARLALTGRF